MKLYFLSPIDGCQKFLKNKEYWKKLQPLEISVRTNGGVSYQPTKPDQMRNEAKEYYCKNIVEFTTKEQEVLTWYIKQLCQIMQQRARNFIPKSWKFIKLRENVDWNFPYTMCDAIVLPETKVREMVIAKCAKTPDLVVSHMKLLFHELVHIKQRENPRLYQKLYHDFWGFRCVEPQDIFYKPLYMRNWVTNPDAMDIKYIIPIVHPGTNYRTDWYLPLLILDPKDIKRQLGILIKLNEVYNEELQRNQYYTSETYQTICSMPRYSNRFYGMDVQLYHPNEIMAHLLADYVVTFKEYMKYNDPKLSSSKFYFTIKKMLNERC